MNKKKILIVGTSYMNLTLSSNNRTNFLPQFLHNNGYDVELITSNFNHHTKERILFPEKKDYKHTLINVPGYVKHVSFKRIRTIITYRRNLKRFLKTKGPVDVVYTFVPTHSVARITFRYAKRVGAKSVIDIRDIWPEVFQIVIKSKVLYKILFFPFIKSADKTYKSADFVIAVSETYRNRARPKGNDSDVVYLGTSFSLVDNILKNNKRIKPSNEIWVTYAGTIGNSYKLENLIKAYKIILDKGYSNIKLLIIGRGPLKNNLIKLDEKLETKVKFIDRVPYDKMIEILQISDIAINSLSKSAPQSIINKHMDYSAVGLPIINTQELPEYCNLVEEYQIGKNVDGSNLEEYANTIIELSLNENLRKKFGDNHRQLGEKLFDRDHNYNKIINILDNLIEK
ncbi:MAG: glycosyltransferase family 4 protein [Bacilli bacterium]|jgi:glycosyltransferase involved in cell wall biosynthesis|nr:glycosyltransferase family 4 protein [Bacilli bacterium]